MSTSLDDLFGPVAAKPDGSEVLAALQKAARERILILDGAMGTQIQGLGFHEEHFRGERFAGCECHLQGNNDLLTLTSRRQLKKFTMPMRWPARIFSKPIHSLPLPLHRPITAWKRRFMI